VGYVQGKKDYCQTKIKKIKIIQLQATAQIYTRAKIEKKNKQYFTGFSGI